MSITMMGTIGAYTKAMKLQTEWTLKKNSGDVSSHKKSLDEWLQSTSQSTSQSSGGISLLNEDERDKLRSILAKLDAGKKLTSQEREYLKAKDPQSYAKLEAAEQEQRAYERELKRCKTKEDVQRLKTAYLNSSLVTVRAVEHNSAISKSKKLEIMAQEKRRCDRIQESTQAFVRRGEYASLPTDSEKAKAEQEEAQRRVPLQDAEASPVENAGGTEQSGENTEEVGRESETSPDGQVRRKDSERPAVHVESAEARKTRRAKAKAAYAGPEGRSDVTAPALDLKA